MAKHEIRTAAACYTGGGIYIYWGRLESGLYFRTCDEWDVVCVCDSDTEAEAADYAEFYEAHTVEEITGDNFKIFWNAMISHILGTGTPGNYSRADLERRTLK